MATENLRRLLGNDVNLYPQLVVTRDSSPSVISIASSVSSVPAVRTKSKPRTVVISDDDENPTIRKVSQGKVASVVAPNAFIHKATPFATRPPNVTCIPTPIPTPIHIPSNRDLPTPKSAPEDLTVETLEIPDFEETYADAFTTPADAERALRDLIAGGIAADADTNRTIDMADAQVDGFKRDVRLLPHQIIGRAWMRERENVAERRAGGILADDMGLGKTIQTLARIVEGRPHKSDRNDGWAAATLVVCPLALVGQWASEIAKMAVGLTVIQHHGPSRTTNPDVLRRAHVVITTYTTLTSEHQAFSPSTKDLVKTNKKNHDADSDSDSSANFGRTVAGSKKKFATTKKAAKKDALYQLRWWRVVLDEAHVIKNRTTKAALACCDVEAKFRWCLTGTPMQNNIEELYSLIKFLRIKPLNDWSKFKIQIAQPINKGRGAGRAMKRLQVVLQKVMLRRLKTHEINGEPLLVLPERRVEIVDCEFDEGERSFYEALETRMETVVERMMNQNKPANYASVLLLLLRLRQACNHPCLVSKDYAADRDAVDPRLAKSSNGDSDSDEEVEKLADVFGQLGMDAGAGSGKRCQLCQKILTEQDKKAARSGGYMHCAECETLAPGRRFGTEDSGLVDSAKIRMIMKLLRAVETRSGSEEKTIVFSQFTSMLDLIEDFLKQGGIRYVRYDGKMSKVQREASLQKIANDKEIRCILISFKAGSIGLNLTACNNVILTDMWWNPALEDQAFDRAHRFGQTRDVNIYKLRIAGTVEERILVLQEKKRELAAAALSGDKIKNMRLGMEELLALFKPGKDDDDDE